MELFQEDSTIFRIPVIVIFLLMLFKTLSGFLKLWNPPKTAPAAEIFFRIITHFL
jgi:hypothetical protein